MALQVLLSLLMISFFSITVQEWLSINNYQHLNPLYFYTNFTFLILLIHSSLTSSPSALLYFFFLLIWYVFDYIFPTTVHRILSQNDLRPFPSVSLFTFWVHPLTPISFVYVCPLHDVITEDVDTTRRRHAGLSLLLFSLLFFIYLTCLRNFFFIIFYLFSNFSFFSYINKMLNLQAFLF